MQKGAGDRSSSPTSLALAPFSPRHPPQPRGEGALAVVSGVIFLSFRWLLITPQPSVQAGGGEREENHAGCSSVLRQSNWEIELSFLVLILESSGPSRLVTKPHQSPCGPASSCFRGSLKSRCANSIGMASSRYNTHTVHEHWQVATHAASRLVTFHRHSARLWGDNEEDHPPQPRTAPKEEGKSKRVPRQ